MAPTLAGDADARWPLAIGRYGGPPAPITPDPRSSLGFATRPRGTHAKTYGPPVTGAPWKLSSDPGLAASAEGALVPFPVTSSGAMPA